MSETLLRASRPAAIDPFTRILSCFTDLVGDKKVLVIASALGLTIDCSRFLRLIKEGEGLASLIHEDRAAIVGYDSVDRELTRTCQRYLTGATGLLMTAVMVLQSPRRPSPWSSSGYRKLSPLTFTTPASLINAESIAQQSDIICGLGFASFTR